MLNPDGHRCPRCEVWKTWDEYHRKASNPNGRQSYCKTCHRALVEKTRDPVRALACAKRYYQTHRAERRAYATKYRAADRERSRRYYQTHRAHCLARAHAYYLAHREQLLAYARDHRKRPK